MKIVSFKICPFVQRVTALLEAKKLPYEIEYINLSEKPDWFLEVSPHGQVPILITVSGTVLFESDAIVEYIEEISAPVEANVSAEQRAIDRAWSYMAAKNYLVQCSAMRSANKDVLLERSERLNTIFRKVENVLDDGPFFKGEHLSMVDIAWLPLLHRAHIIHQHRGYDFLKDYPKVQAWQSSLINTGLAEKSVSEDFEEKFTGFYLSNKTYLGCGFACDSDLDTLCESRSCC